jgi:amidase
MAGGEQDYMDATKKTGEPILTDMEPMGSNVPPPWRSDTSRLSAYELWQVQRKKRELRKEFLDHWEATVAVSGTGRPVDAIICPVAAYLAAPHGQNRCAVGLTAGAAHLGLIEYAISLQERGIHDGLEWL